VNCSLTDKDRESGYLCRSFECEGCRRYKGKTWSFTAPKDGRYLVRNDSIVYLGKGDRMEKKKIRAWLTIVTSILEVKQEIAEKGSRELSLVLTKLEEAKHWYDQHVELEELMSDEKPKRN